MKSNMNTWPRYSCMFIPFEIHGCVGGYLTLIEPLNFNGTYQSIPRHTQCKKIPM